MTQEHSFKVGPLRFVVGNYKDWKPGYQLRLGYDMQGVLNTDRTFKTIDNAKKYVQKQLLKMAKEIIFLVEEQK